jgi:hypothetical protein
VLARQLFDLAIIAPPFLRPLRLLSLAVVIDVLQRAIGDNIRGRVTITTVGYGDIYRVTGEGTPPARRPAPRRSGSCATRSAYSSRR